MKLKAIAPTLSARGEVEEEGREGRFVEHVFWEMPKIQQ